MASVKVGVPKYRVSKRTGKLRRTGYTTHIVHVPMRNR